MTTNALPTLNLVDNERHSLDRLIATVRGYWNDSQFRLFGSKVTGKTDDESDLDLLVTLPCPVTNEIRQRIIHHVFALNLEYGSNISAMIVSKDEWDHPPLSLLPIHSIIEQEGIPL